MDVYTHRMACIRGTVFAKRSNRLWHAGHHRFFQRFIRHERHRNPAVEELPPALAHNENAVMCSHPSLIQVPCSAIRRRPNPYRRLLLPLDRLPRPAQLFLPLRILISLDSDVGQLFGRRLAFCRQVLRGSMLIDSLKTRFQGRSPVYGTVFETLPADLVSQQHGFCLVR
jgi:hypothetical protein